MIRAMLRQKLRVLIATVCLASLLAGGACCTGERFRTVIVCGVASQQLCCETHAGFCPFGDVCGDAFVGSDCDTIITCDPSPFITSLEPVCIETHDLAVPNVDFKIHGSGLANVTSIKITQNGVIDNEITVQPGSLQASDSLVTAKINISENAESGPRKVSVSTLAGTTSNEQFFQIDDCPPAAPGQMTLFQALQRPLSGHQVGPNGNLFSQALPSGSVVLTPVADGTVQQIDATTSQAGATRTIITSGPATSAKVAQIRGTPFDVVDREFSLNFQRFGITTGGVLGLTATTNVEAFAKSLPVRASQNTALKQTSFGTAGAVEFDLSSLKTALQQLNLNASSIRATLRLTPIRSLNLFDFVSGSTTQLPSTAQVILLDTTQDQRDLVIDYKDFPGFTSPRVSNLDGLGATVITAPASRRATVRTDLLGLLAPVSFDVTEAVQRDLQSSSSSTGFQIASELNGTGLVFADSSNIIPGVSGPIAPQLIIELSGLTPPNQARFIASASQIPFDTLAQGFTDMMLVTINNIGASTGTINIDLTSGANVFGLVTTDGRALGNQTNTAMIAAGERLTFGVTFTPSDGDSFQGEVQVTDTTGGKSALISKIALTGTTLPASFSQNLPKISAPIKPQRLPDHAARVGDLNGDGLIDAADISRLAAIVTSSVAAPSPGTAAFAVADINGDGMIDRADLTILGDAVARNRDALPRLRPDASEILQTSRTQRQASGSALADNPTARGRTGVAVMPRAGR